MVHKVGFFDKDTPINQTTLTFSTPEKCLTLALDNSSTPNPFLNFLKTSFESGHIQSGCHPVLGSLLDFAFKVYANSPCNKNPIVTYFQEILPDYFIKLAKDQPDVCYKLLKREEKRGHLLYGKHFFLGSLTGFRKKLDPAATPVIELLDTVLARYQYADKAIHQTSQIREALINDNQEGKIVSGQHSELGSLYLLGMEIYHIAPPVRDCGPQLVLSYLEGVGVWTYPELYEESEASMGI
jgi:hypothetical protein